MIKKFSTYNESLRDKMTSKSDKEIKRNLSKLDIDKWIYKVRSLKLDDSFLPSDDEIKVLFSGLNLGRWIKAVNGLELDDKFLPSDEEIKKYFNELPPYQKIKQGVDLDILSAVKDGIEKYKGVALRMDKYLITAANRENVDMVKCILDYEKIRIKDVSYARQYIKRDYISKKILNDKRKEIEKLLYDKELGISSDSKDYNKMMKIGCETGNINLVRTAFEKGADINPKYSNYLHDTIRNNYYDIVKFLIDNGYPIDNTSHSKSIGVAINNNRVEIVKLLQSHGSKVDFDQYGFFNRKINEWIQKDQNDEIITFLIKQNPEMKDNLNNEIVEYQKKINKIKKYL